MTTRFTLTVTYDDDPGEDLAEVLTVIALATAELDGVLHVEAQPTDAEFPDVYVATRDDDLIDGHWKD